MKKILIIIISILFVVTIYYTTSFYLEIYKNQERISLELKTNFLDQQKIVSDMLKSYETTAADLAKIQDPNLLKDSVAGDIFSIVILDSERKFSSGWELDPSIHEKVHSLITFELPETTSEIDWVSIKLNAALLTCRGIYILPRDDNTYLVVTYDLLKALNSIESLSFGFKSFAQVEQVATGQIIAPFTSSRINPVDRLTNDTIQLEAPVSDQWILVFFGIWEDLYPYPLEIIRAFFYLIVLWGALTISIATLLLKAAISKPKSLWILSFIFNAFCLILIIFFFLDFPARSAQITEKTNSFRKTQELFKKGDSTLLIPTTIRIKSLSFPDDASFLVSGFISQIYPKNMGLEIGFVFPEETSAYPSSLTEISRWETNESVLILWQFTVGLGGSFPPTFFPFDERILNIVLWPKEIHKSVVFLPNFINYETLIMSTKPGIDPTVNPIGWNVKGSYFLMGNQAPYDFFTISHAPLSFKFTVYLERDFLGAFLSNALALVLCIVVAFLVLFIPRDSLLDSLFATVSIFVGLIFIAVTNHASLRETLQVSSFAYCEYLFISFYLLLLAITIDFILCIGKPIPKTNFRYLLAITYWPILIGSFTLIITLSVLY